MFYGQKVKYIFHIKIMLTCNIAYVFWLRYWNSEYFNVYELVPFTFIVSDSPSFFGFFFKEKEI